MNRKYVPSKELLHLVVQEMITSKMYELDYTSPVIKHLTLLRRGIEEHLAYLKQQRIK